MRWAPALVCTGATERRDWYTRDKTVFDCWIRLQSHGSLWRTRRTLSLPHTARAADKQDWTSHISHFWESFFLNKQTTSEKEKKKEKKSKFTGEAEALCGFQIWEWNEWQQQRESGKNPRYNADSGIVIW